MTMFPFILILLGTSIHSLLSVLFPVITTFPFKMTTRMEERNRFISFMPHPWDHLLCPNHYHKIVMLHSYLAICTLFVFQIERRWHIPQILFNYSREKNNLIDISLLSPSPLFHRLLPYGFSLFQLLFSFVSDTEYTCPSSCHKTTHFPRGTCMRSLASVKVEGVMARGRFH